MYLCISLFLYVEHASIPPLVRSSLLSLVRYFLMSFIRDFFLCIHRYFFRYVCIIVFISLFMHFVIYICFRSFVRSFCSSLFSSYCMYLCISGVLEFVSRSMSSFLYSAVFFMYVRVSLLINLSSSFVRYFFRYLCVPSSVRSFFIYVVICSVRYVLSSLFVTSFVS